MRRVEKLLDEADSRKSIGSAPRDLDVGDAQVSQSPHCTKTAFPQTPDRAIAGIVQQRGLGWVKWTAGMPASPAQVLTLMVVAEVTGKSIAMFRETARPVKDARFSHDESLKLSARSNGCAEERSQLSKRQLPREDDATGTSLKDCLASVAVVESGIAADVDIDGWDMLVEVRYQGGIGDNDGGAARGDGFVQQSAPQFHGIGSDEVLIEGHCDWDLMLRCCLAERSQALDGVHLCPCEVAPVGGELLSEFMAPILRQIADEELGGSRNNQLVNLVHGCRGRKSDNDLHDRLLTTSDCSRWPEGIQCDETQGGPHTMVDRSMTGRWLDWSSAPTSGVAADWTSSTSENIELALFMHGIKPAVKVEDQSLEAIAALRTMAGSVGAFMEVVERDSGPSAEERDMDSGAGSRLSQVFLSREESAMPLLVEMERRERRGGNQRREAMIRSGEMLGYPACCVRFFANLPRQDDKAVLAAYGAGAGVAMPSHPYFNIFPPMVSPITWYPCSFHCASALSLAREGAAKLQMCGHELSMPPERLAGITIVFQRFLFVHLHDVTRSGDWMEYGKVSDALSWTRDPLFVEAEILREFRLRVTEPLAAGCALRLVGDVVEMRLADGGPLVRGDLQKAPLIFYFRAHEGRD